jgi:WD40 repeat protein
MSGSFVSRRTVRTRFLHAHSAKIKLCDLHPTKPWLATADENGRVQVWNYAANSVVIDFDVSSFSQMSLVDSFLEGFVDDKRALDAKPEKCGDVKKILFFDYDVIGVSVPLVARQKIFPTVPVAERFLVIICEQRVLVWSLESHAVVDLSTQDPVFEGKSISSGCLVPSKNRIMIGCMLFFFFFFNLSVSFLSSSSLDEDDFWYDRLRELIDVCLMVCTVSDGSLRRADLPHLGNLARPSGPSPHGKHISGTICIENWESYSPTAPMQPTVVSVAADGTMCGWNSEFMSLEFEKSKVRQNSHFICSLFLS